MSLRSGRALRDLPDRVGMGSRRYINPGRRDETLGIASRNNLAG